MADDISNLPPHVRAQIAEAGRAISDNTTRVENVQPQSQVPTDWQRQGHNQLPEPSKVQDIDPQQQEQPERKP